MLDPQTKPHTRRKLRSLGKNSLVHLLLGIPWLKMQRDVLQPLLAHLERTQHRLLSGTP